jgi:hypothetical protein
MCPCRRPAKSQPRMKHSIGSMPAHCSCRLDRHAPTYDAQHYNTTALIYEFEKPSPECTPQRSFRTAPVGRCPPGEGGHLVSIDPRTMNRQHFSRAVRGSSD